MKSTSLKETRAIAQSFLKTLAPEQRGATVVALSGDLGSGKTTFVQCLGELLGVAEAVTSPTFVIMKRFPTSDSQFSTLVHIDAYRLEDGNELEQLGWNDIVTDPRNLIVLEWPERVEDALPAYTKRISFQFVDEQTRVIDF